MFNKLLARKKIKVHFTVTLKLLMQFNYAIFWNVHSTKMVPS